jgi:hypothetical protein
MFAFAPTPRSIRRAQARPQDQCLLIAWAMVDPRTGIPYRAGDARCMEHAQVVVAAHGKTGGDGVEIELVEYAEGSRSFS